MEDSVNDEGKFEEAIKKYDSTGGMGEKIKDLTSDINQSGGEDVQMQILRQLRLSNAYNERSSKNLAFVSWIYIISIVIAIMGVVILNAD